MGYRDKFRSIFHVKDTPHKIAVSFAIGIFWGLSPLLGLHTLGAFVTAWLFGLNRFITIFGAYITNPWTIVPIYTLSLWIGIKIVGMKGLLPVIDWDKITFTYFWSEIKGLLLPFIVGTLFVGIISAVISYIIVYQLVTKYHKRKTRVEHAA